jgi:hypothetical protein
MEKIFGGLFEFEGTEQLDKFINELDKTTALKIIDMVLRYGQQQGFYSLTESHCIYKCLSKLKQNENKD